MNVIIAIDKQDKVLTNIASNLVELLDKEPLNPSLDIVPLTRDVNLFMSNRWDNMKFDFILRLRTSYVTSNRSTYQKSVSSNTQGPFGFRLLHTSHSLLEKEGWGQYGFNPCTEFKGCLLYTSPPGFNLQGNKERHQGGKSGGGGREEACQ